MKQHHEPPQDAEDIWQELSEPDDPSFDSEEQSEPDRAEPKASGRRERLTIAGARVRRAKSHGLRALLHAGAWRMTGLQRGLLLLCGAAALLLLLLALLVITAVRPPEAAGDGRIDGKYAFLLAGTDQDGVRTDTMMLAALDCNAHTASIMSLPRDTLVLTGGEPMKLNALYTYGGMGHEGMAYLSGRVSEMLGIPIDGYCQISLDAFARVVDQLGGVWFDVPVDMVYDDPWQDLHIDLKAGYQQLNGVQATHLLRYRAGYYNADLGRVEVQQAFLTAMAEQCLRPGSLAKLGGVLQTVSGELLTDLDAGNLAYLGLQLLKAQQIQTDTMPGSAEGIYLDGQNYYVIYGLDTLALVNASYSPLQSDITLDGVNMMRLSGQAIVYADGTYYAPAP